MSGKVARVRSVDTAGASDDYFKRGFAITDAAAAPRRKTNALFDARKLKLASYRRMRHHHR
jgi:hypothetical protein